MKRNIIFISAIFTLCCAFAPAAKAQPLSNTDMMMSDHKIIELSDKYLAMLDTFFPEDAARAGMLGYQSKLDARDKQSEAIRKETLMALQDTLNRVDYKKLSPLVEIDYRVLREIVDRKIFDIQTRSRVTKNPLWYLESIDAVYDILIKDYKLPQERLVDALKRLQSVPSVLALGKENLDNPPDLLLRIALERASLAYSSFNNLTTLMNRMAPDDYTKAQVKAISEDAKKAIKDYFDFLKKMAENKKYVDFRLGPEDFDKLLGGVYGINTPVRRINQMLEKEIETSRTALIDALTPVIESALSKEDKEKRITKKGVILIRPSDYYAAANALNKGPKEKETLNTFLNYYNESADFFAKKEVFLPGNLKVIIGPAPKFLQRKYENARYIPPFPLVTRPTGDLLVNLPQDAKEAEEIMPKLFTYSKIKLSAVANLSAGNNLMYSAAANFRTNLLRVSNSPFYVNGWIKYALNIAKEKGYLTEDEDRIHIAWHNYKTALLALAETRMHNGDLNYTQSLEYLTAAGMEKEEAAAALDIAAVEPCTYLSAMMGEQEFSRLRKKHQSKAGSKFKMNDFHSKMLSTGRIPLPMVELALEQAYQTKKVDSFFNTLYF